MDDLESATGIDDHCMNIYLLQALSGNLKATLDAYRDELDNNYDEKFGWYEEASNFDFTAFLANETMCMGDISDAVMISASVTSMSQVADAGQQYEDEKIENTILLFLTGVLFLIPGLE